MFDGYYFLITNLSQYSGQDLAELYSERGKAELQMKAASEFAFSSSSRKKSSYRGRPIEHESCEEEDETRPENCVRIQLYMLIYQLLHVGLYIMYGAPELDTESGSDIAAEQDADTT